MLATGTDAAAHNGTETKTEKVKREIKKIILFSLHIKKYKVVPISSVVLLGEKLFPSVYNCDCFILEKIHKVVYLTEVFKGCTAHIGTHHRYIYLCRERMEIKGQSKLN